ncbi:ribosomal protein S6 kinase alpha-4-like [Contarinia nasturtii]|uniref:ribosomal protein S6 kinase alpha-4-like n=1 Tax=Contarinia nasturtii TaxID=265458 RepID=UPI0012D3CAF1|nr:ribosomal protein S6 kinase alpha-4-like [Contarinia nasturtii]
MSNNSRNSLTILSLIDAGNFGCIHLACKNGGIDDGLLYAVKTITPDPKFDYSHQHRICRNEFRTLKLVHDVPFFIQLKYASKTRHAYHFVMDYILDGNLFNHLQAGVLTLKEMKVCCAEIILAIEYLHRYRIVYRDLKLENVLIAGDGHILLTDFGLAQKINKNERLQGEAGTLAYFAPEMLSDNGHSFEVDWWSLGIVAFELLVGHSPFLSSSKRIDDQTHRSRIKNESPYLKKLSYLGPNAKSVMDFIQQLLIKNPAQRLGAGHDGYEAVKKHAFFSQLNWTMVKLKKYSCIERKQPGQYVKIRYTKHCELSLEEPKENRRKEFYYVAPEFQEEDDFFGFTEDDISALSSKIPLEAPMCNIQLRSDLLIVTNKPTEVIKQMILPKMTFNEALQENTAMIVDDDEPNDENVPNRSDDDKVRRSNRTPKRNRRFSMIF